MTVQKGAVKKYDEKKNMFDSACACNSIIISICLGGGGGNFAAGANCRSD